MAAAFAFWLLASGDKAACQSIPFLLRLFQALVHLRRRAPHCPGRVLLSQNVNMVDVPDNVTAATIPCCETSYCVSAKLCVQVSGQRHESAQPPASLAEDVTATVFTSRNNNAASKTGPTLGWTA